MRMRAEQALDLVRGIPTSLSRTYYRTTVYLALAVFAAALALVITTSYGVSFSGRQDACCVSEWLINYGGGFVRRGLGGAAILWMAGISGMSPRVIVFAILAVSYSIFFASLAVIVSRIRRLDYLELLLAVSPCAALFPVFHRVAGQRKEILLLALAGAAGATPLGQMSSVTKYVCWSLVFAAVVAIHDGSIFFLPLFVIYLRVVTPPCYPMGYRALWLMVPAAGVFLLGYLYSAKVDTGSICTAMNAAAKGDWCVTGSAVAWLNSNALDGVRSVIHGYTSTATVFATGTLLPGLAGLIPVAIALRRDAAGLRRLMDDLPFGPLFPWLAGLAIAVVFCVADDGNRWFYITTMILTLVHFRARYNTMRGSNA
ncbi:MAG TPA: hypothetical protein VNY82_05810 [Steroidobacteraceae bacterium]|nr:hypothetical protein [Steroidobacteraceae bacterium]